ncbi:hypothetical protein F5Y11DRAFT_353591 [Daldinia sp. FL1419]|nr:hypothetical protein F5Y11DRAFT_353591 [Daldinia sp. FL1419]
MSTKTWWSARLAQSVERETLNLKVAGSTPASGSIPDASQLTGIADPNSGSF